MTYGVLGTTNSRVPITRPGRPMAGKRRRRSTARRTEVTTRTAAAGSSRAMYSASESRFASAVRSHLTRTARPFLQRSLHFLNGGKISPIRLGQGFCGFFDLPIVQSDIFANRLGRYERPASAGCLREEVQLLLELGVKTEREYRRSSHGMASCIHATSCVVVCMRFKRGPRIAPRPASRRPVPA